MKPLREIGGGNGGNKNRHLKRRPRPALLTGGCRGPTVQFPAKTSFGCDRKVQRDFHAILEEFPLASSAPSSIISRAVLLYFPLNPGWMVILPPKKRARRAQVQSALRAGKSSRLVLSRAGAVTSTVPRHNLRVRKMNAFFLLRPNYPHFHPLFSCIERARPSLHGLRLRPDRREAMLAFVPAPPLNLSLIKSDKFPGKEHLVESTIPA